MLDNRVVLVTGAAGGIGRATIVAFARAGARVVGSDLEIGDIDNSDFSKLGAHAPPRFLEHDVSSRESWESALANVGQSEGPIDVLVNNAGVSLGRPIADIELEDWRWVMSVNLDGVFLGTKYGIRSMRGRGGAIVNVSSALAVVGRPLTGAVAASKAGILALTRTAALEAAARQYNIRVNAVLPGGVDTGIFRGQSWWPEHRFGSNREDEARSNIIGDTPMGRLARPEEIAKAIVFLASDDASFITGTTLTVDGGFTAA
jgi:3(or 17)beta-hydroxysteroid dehydrogenase